MPAVGQSGQSLEDAFPLGLIIENVKVVRVEAERGLICEIGDRVPAFVHVSVCSAKAQLDDINFGYRSHTCLTNMSLLCIQTVGLGRLGAPTKVA